MTVPVTATESGITLGSLVTVEKVEMKGSKMDVTVRNNSSENISHVIFIIIPQNEAGEIIFMSAPSPEESETDAINFYSLKPGKTASGTWDIQSVFPGSTHVKMAALFVEINDDTTIWFAEKDFRWFSFLEQKYINCPEGRNTNYYPDKMTWEKGNSIHLGFEYRNEMSWVDEHFGYHYTGYLVNVVDEDSLAAKAGLQLYDLITAVNGLTCTENPFALTYGIAEMADTGKMTLTVERYGEEGTFEVELTQEK